MMVIISNFIPTYLKYKYIFFFISISGRIRSRIRIRILFFQLSRIRIRGIKCRILIPEFLTRTDRLSGPVGYQTVFDILYPKLYIYTLQIIATRNPTICVFNAFYSIYNSIIQGCRSGSGFI